MSEGYVYVLSNPSMPGIVKIGRSKHGGRVRAKDLYAQATGVPEPFRMEFELWTDDCEEVELLVHELLQRDRINTGREFFRVEVYDAIKSVMQVFAESMDCTVGRQDSVVDEINVQHYAFQLRQSGFDDFCFPDISIALSTLDIGIVIDQIKRINQQREDAKANKEPDEKLGETLRRLGIS